MAWKLLVTAIAVVLAVACGGSSESTTVFDQIGLLTPPDEKSDDFVESLAREREASDAAAICMRSYGYEYIPWTSAEIVAPALLDAPPRGTQEFAAEVGYGILFNLPRQLETHPAAKQDPNLVFLDGLSRDQQAVYYQTLYGAGAGVIGPRAQSVDPDLYQEGGCLGRELNRDGSTTRANLLGSLRPSFHDLAARANADPRLLAYDATWSACMAESGYRYASTVTAQADFEARFAELWSGADFPSSNYSADELASMTRSERAEIYADTPGFDRETWMAHLADEIEVATQDHVCQRDQQRFDIYAEVLRGFEQQWILENESAVNTLLATE